MPSSLSLPPTDLPRPGCDPDLQPAACLLLQRAVCQAQEQPQLQHRSVGRKGRPGGFTSRGHILHGAEAAVTPHSTFHPQRPSLSVRVMTPLRASFRT